MNKRRMLFRLWVPTLTILLIPILLLNLNLRQLTSEIETNSAERYLSETTYSATQIETILHESVFYGNILLSNPDIQALRTVSDARTVGDYAKFTAASDVLKNDAYRAVDYTISIYYNRANILISGASLYLNPQNVYGTLFSILDYSFEDLKTISSQQRYGLRFYPFGINQIDGSEQSGIVYSRPIAVFNDEANGGALFVHFKEQFWERNLPRIEDDDGYILVINGDDEIIYASSPQAETIDLEALDINESSGLLDSSILSSDYIGAYSKLRYDIRILTVRSRSSVLASVMPLLRLTQTLNVVAVAAILLTVILILYRLGNQQYRQQAMTRDFFWDRALSNGTPQHLEELAKRSGIKIDERAYSVLFLIKIRASDSEDFDYKQLDEIKRYREHLIELLSPRYSLTTIGAEQLILILPIRNTQYYQYEADRLLDELDPPEKLSLRLACSEPFHQFEHFYPRYLACRNAVDLSGGGDREIRFAGGAISGDSTLIYFPIELETQLISGIQSGDSEIVKNAFRSVVQENFFQKSISRMMYDMLISKFKLILLKVYTEQMPKSLSTYLEFLNESGTESSKFSAIYSVLQDLCTYYREAREAKDNQLPQMLESYLASRYNDKDMSIQMAAEDFGYSESYFSRMFKDATGHTFSAYLETLRLQEADKLLVESTESIETIADRVGYSSSNSFRRAYRRQYNIPPSQRRSQTE